MLEFSSVTNTIITINYSWKMEVLNIAKKNPPEVEKVTPPIIIHIVSCDLFLQSTCWVLYMNQQTQSDE